MVSAGFVAWANIVLVVDNNMNAASIQFLFFMNVLLTVCCAPNSIPACNSSYKKQNLKPQKVAKKGRKGRKERKENLKVLQGMAIHGFAMHVLDKAELL